MKVLLAINLGNFSHIFGKGVTQLSFLILLWQVSSKIAILMVHSDGSNYVSKLIFDSSKSKIGCSSSITKK